MRIPLACLVFSFFFCAKACLILFLTNGKEVLVAIHEDWFARDAAVKFSPAGIERFASITFTFMREGWAQGGLNEHGLFFDGAYTPYQEIEFDAEKSDFSGYIWQSMLDKCRNVEEAIAFISSYRLPDLEEAHIMLADASGRAALVGVENHKVVISYAEELLLQTNFNPWQPELSEEPGCKRYQKAMQLVKTDSILTNETMLDVLQSTHQDSLTVYSNIYDLKARTVTVYDRLNFNAPYTFRFDSQFPATETILPLANRSSKSTVLPSSNYTVHGRVQNQEGEGLAFVNIGVEGTNYGTISDPDGSFELKVSAELLKDSISFSSIGFGTKKIRIQEFLSNQLIVLAEHARVLDEVVVEEKKRYKIARLGYMKGKDGILPFDTLQGGGAVALLLNAPRKGFYVDKLQFRLMYNSKDTLQFRLHFYAYDAACDCPGEELLHDELILKEQQTYGWVRFNLADQDLFIDANQFFVGLEWIDLRKTRRSMLEGLRDWESWKKQRYEEGDPKVEKIASKHPDGSPWTYFKYHGNMMNWRGWNTLPPFTGLMIETGKTKKTASLRTFERKTSFSPWVEKAVTLNAVVVVSY